MKNDPAIQSVGSRIALVHDYFTQQGGAERVAEQLYFLLSKPDVFSTVALKEALPPGLVDAKITTSWMQKLPKMKSAHRLYFPLYPLGVESLDLNEYDVVVSSSSGYAKGVKTKRGAIHVCYCHTPMRWVWRYDDYCKREGFGLGKRLVLPLLMGGLRTWDKSAARQPDQFVANSQTVAERIEKIYKRHAVVIPPPIDMARFQISRRQSDYYLVLSRLVSYKRIDLAIQACNLLGRRLVIVGDGPDRGRLTTLAGPTTEFVGRLSDEETARYAGECRALLFPGEEDFGMVPLEVAAAGRPTIAFRRGGATETIIEGQTGVFFDSQDAMSLAGAIEEFETLSWSPSILRNNAASYDIHVFRSKFLELLRSMGIKLDGVYEDSRRLASLKAAN